MDTSCTLNPRSHRCHPTSVGCYAICGLCKTPCTKPALPAGASANWCLQLTGSPPIWRNWQYRQVLVFLAV